ncbi:hypothetical protein DE146DRAFT_764721 [Phaeosphaeria sp. MPI-PUGE-AT-0046c]|nr:hypothetical protein DE146DRAFT_764721 [Phaeosphaeria sp. MPI-PUGE-AT-0046c]
MSDLKLRPALLERREGHESNIAITSSSSELISPSRRPARNTGYDRLISREKDKRTLTETSNKNEHPRKRAKLEIRAALTQYTQARFIADQAALEHSSISSLPLLSLSEIPLAQQSPKKLSVKLRVPPAATATSQAATPSNHQDLMRLENDHLEVEKARLQVDNDKFKAENDRLKAAKTHLSDKVTSLSAEAIALNITGLTKDYQTLRDRTTEIELQNRDLTSKNQTLEIQIKTATIDKNRLAQVSVENARWREQASASVKDKDDVIKENDGLKKQILKLDTEVKEEIKAFEEYKKRVRALGNEFRDPGV